MLEAAGDLKVRTENGRIIEGVHPLSFAGQDLLDRYGLTPGPAEAGEEDALNGPPSAARKPVRTPVRIPVRIPVGARAEEPAEKPATEPRSDGTFNGAMAREVPTFTQRNEVEIMSAEPVMEPAISARNGGDPVSVSVATVTAEAADVVIGPGGARTGEDGQVSGDPREALRDLIALSGRSQAAMSRDLGKDPSFLNAILTRGRRMPPDLPDLIRALIAATASSATPGDVPNPVSETAIPEQAGAIPPEALAEVTGPAEITVQAGIDAPTSLDVSVPISSGLFDAPLAGGGERSDLIVLETPPAEPDPAVIEVIIDGVCRVRVPIGFDMEAAARLIRSVSAPFRTQPRQATA